MFSSTWTSSCILSDLSQPSFHNDPLQPPRAIFGSCRVPVIHACHAVDQRRCRTSVYSWPLQSSGNISAMRSFHQPWTIYTGKNRPWGSTHLTGMIGVNRRILQNGSHALLESVLVIKLSVRWFVRLIHRRWGNDAFHPVSAIVILIILNVWILFNWGVVLYPPSPYCSLYSASIRSTPRSAEASCQL